MPRAIILAAILWTLVGGTVCVASAEGRSRMEDPFEITADRITYEAERELYVAEGNVHVLQAGRSLVARWVAYSKKTGIGVAEGDVELVDGADRLFSAFMAFDIDTLKGTLYQVAFDSGSNGFRLRAKEMIRTGKNTFTVEDSVFSTCRCEPGEKLPWQIETDRADVELGGYGQLKNSTFDVLGVPVLWIPWMMLPIKSERESGLLLPQFQFGGRGGASFGLPVFLAPLPQLNITATPRYFVNRGFKQDVELEYVFGEQSAGKLFVAGLEDKTKQARSSFNPQRWGLLWEHDHFLPRKLRWQTDLKLASDNLYADDFREMQRFKTFRFNESTTNVARSFGESGGFGAMVGMRYADDLQGPSFNDRDEYLLQRFAEVRGDVQPGTLRGPLGVEARVDSELIHFSGLRTPESELSGDPIPGPDLDPNPPNTDPRSIPAALRLRNNGRFIDLGVNGRYDDTPGVDGEGDGIYQPGEPLDERGTRMIVHPRFARPTKLGGLFELTPEVGYSQALYQTNAQRFAGRGLITARAELRSRLARDFLSPSGSSVHHVIEPKVGWAWVSEDVLGRGQQHNPLFVPLGQVAQSRFRSLSLENVTRDPSDRIRNANQLVLGMTQRFFTRAGARSTPRLVADLTTAIDWDFKQRVAGGPSVPPDPNDPPPPSSTRGTHNGGLGNLFVDARLLRLGPFSSRVRGAFNPESKAVKEGEAEIGLNVPFDDAFLRNLVLSARYRYLRRLPDFFETVRGITSTSQQGDSALNQIDLDSKIELTARIRFTYRAVYSLVDDGFIRNRGMIEYVSKCRCWGVGVGLYQERRVGFGGGLMIRFLGLGDDDTELFDGGFGSGLNF